MNEKQIKEIRNNLIWTLDEVSDMSERDMAKVFNRAGSTINRVIQEKPDDWPPGE